MRTELRSIIENACADEGCPLNALTVLASHNDPFRVDTPARRRNGEWFAKQIKRLRGDLQTYLRGFHYVLVSAKAVKPNGKRYANTFTDWQWMSEKAAKAARWLGLVPFVQIYDARNEEPVIVVREEQQPWPFVSTEVEIEIPDLSYIEPWVGLAGFEGVQLYRLVLFGEKTSLRDVLGPVAEEHQTDLYLPTGEISDTQLHRMAGVGAEDGRRMIVLTFCDCDPAGWQMPISIARKLQALKVIEFPDLDFHVYRVALTPEQVRDESLPSTPLKASEKRADKWKRATGVEQTEIDALATLNPDLLRQIALDAIAPFHDPTLDSRVDEVRSQWRTAAQELLDEYVDEERLERFRDETETALDMFRDKVDALNETIEFEVGGFKPPEIPAVPEAEVDGRQSTPPLIDSSWSWTEQTLRLKASRAYEDLS